MTEEIVAPPKPIWTEGRYAGHYFTLSRNIKGTVHWKVDKDDKNWTAYFLDTKLGSWDELAEAKKAVEVRAKAELEYALKRLAQFS